MWLRPLRISGWDYSEVNNAKVELLAETENRRHFKAWYLHLFASQRNVASLRKLMLLNNLCPSRLTPKMAELLQVWFTASYVGNCQQQLWQMTLMSYDHFIHAALVCAKRWGRWVFWNKKQVSKLRKMLCEGEQCSLCIHKPSVYGPRYKNDYTEFNTSFMWLGWTASNRLFKSSGAQI